MATEFCCRSGGSNLNAGTRNGSATEPGTSADFTYLGGAYASGVFTVASGNPLSDGVAVGDFASIYIPGSTVTGFVARVTARTATTITVSTSIKAGTAPANGTCDLKIGGAWQGPNGAVAFPFGFFQGTATDITGNLPRVNFKNDQTYSITTTMVHGTIGPADFQGYTTTYGDLGRATVDGGTLGAAYVLLTVNSSGVDRNRLIDFNFENNGQTGTADGVSCTSDRFLFLRCSVQNVRGNGFLAGLAVECEARNCNQNNSTSAGGFRAGAANIGTFIRCISHHHSQGNGVGFYDQSGNTSYINCIAANNGQYGFYFNNLTASVRLLNCDAYSNGQDGVRVITGSGPVFMENCNFTDNGGIAVNRPSGTATILMFNCGLGSGSAANAGLTSPAVGCYTADNVFMYPANAVPWVNPTTGDFRINLAEAKNAGRGNFTQVALGGSFTGTVGYPDIGAAMHIDAGGGGGATTPVKYWNGSAWVEGAALKWTGSAWE